MLYMLDTNICCYILNKQPSSYYKKLEQLEQSAASITISSIVLSELQFGVANSKFKEQNQTKLNLLMSKLEVLDYSAKCAFFYGNLRADLKKRGIIIGNNDLFIASHAIAEQATLITNNISEFKRVKELILENWD